MYNVDYARHGGKEGGQVNEPRPDPQTRRPAGIEIAERPSVKHDDGDGDHLGNGFQLAEDIGRDHLPFLGGDEANGIDHQVANDHDNDAENKDEFEKSLVLSINKAVTEILYSYPFSFRERTQIFITVPNIDTYDIPSGIIKRDERGDYCIRINSKSLNVCARILSIHSRKY